MPPAGILQQYRLQMNLMMIERLEGILLAYWTLQNISGGLPVVAMNSESKGNTLENMMSVRGADRRRGRSVKKSAIKGRPAPRW